MKGVIAFFTAVLLLLSCSQQEVCEEGLTPEVITTFYTYQLDGTLSDTIVSGIYMYGIRSDRPDSLLYDSTTASRIYFPLDPNNDYSEFVLSIQDIADTIKINHSSTVYLVSFTCGFFNDFTMTSISHTINNIKNIELIKEYVNAEEVDVEEHLKLYF